MLVFVQSLIIYCDQETIESLRLVCKSFSNQIKYRSFDRLKTISDHLPNLCSYLCKLFKKESSMSLHLGLFPIIKISFYVHEQTPKIVDIDFGIHFELIDQWRKSDSLIIDIFTGMVSFHNDKQQLLVTHISDPFIADCFYLSELNNRIKIEQHAINSINDESQKMINHWIKTWPNSKNKFTKLIEKSIFSLQLIIDSKINEK